MKNKYIITIGDTKMGIPSYKKNPKISESEYRYTDSHPYVSTGMSRETKPGVAYTGFKADVAEFNDMYMRDFHYTPFSVNKMGLGIDEVLESSINFSRKNYACYFPTKPFPEDVKLVGNTIKSKKMPTYIENFLTIGIRQLLRGEGQDFISEYYSYIDKIYNMRIPLKDIATKGKVKKSIEQYKKDIKEITKAGRPKSRQAWYELAIQNDLHVDNGDTIYYVNTGKSKSQSDVKKVTHYFYNDDNGEKIEFTKLIDKEYKAYKKDTETHGVEAKTKKEWLDKTYPNHFTEEEIIMFCMLVPREVIDSENDILCDEVNIEYNVAKYVEMFNKRIKPLLVCFDKEIRDMILVNNPDDRKFFTEEQCKLSSGQPNKPSDQDTYEQLMTMEDKEIKFWMTYDLIPPFLKECEMGTWDDIKEDYIRRMEEEKRLGIDIERKAYEKAINELTTEDIDNFEEDGDIPLSISKIIDIDPLTGNFVSKRYPDIVIGNMYDILEGGNKNDDFDDFAENISSE